ncbi:MAG: hypothetical protein LBC51_00630 [Treponema sp.]|jgi:hypothetical protein|nr:hypothetical protein [Treponema sp.]
MAGSNDWLNGREKDFVVLCRKWKTGLGNPANVTAFDWKQPEVDEASGKIGDFLDAYTAYEENNSTKNRLAKDAAKTEAKKIMRDFANTSIRYNKLMKIEDKLVYGIRPADSSSTPAGEPKTYPEAEADTSVIRQVTIRFWDSATKKRAKPHGVHGAEIRWAILEQEPASEKDLTNSDFDTASPLTMRFDETQRGQRLYYCLRWESTTNLKGPFGEIYSTVIP